MGIRAYGERLEHRLDTTPQQTTGCLPTPTESDLFNLHLAKFKRHGIMAMLLNTAGHLLLLEHRASAKIEEGMWGTLGETSHVINTAAGWQVEPTGTTLLRGVKEELGIDVDQKDLRVPTRLPQFTCEWPVGIQYPGQISNAICPVVGISPLLERAILDSQPTDEITQARFTSLDRVSPFLRPGMTSWLERARLVTIHNEGSPWGDFTQPDWIYSKHPEVKDAILNTMFDPMGQA